MVAANNSGGSTRAPLSTTAIPPEEMEYFFVDFRGHQRGRHGHRLPRIPRHLAARLSGDSDEMSEPRQPFSLCDRSHHRFKLSHRGQKLRRRVLTPEAGVAVPGSEQAFSLPTPCTVLGHTIGRGHHAMRYNRYLRGLGCHRRWFLCGGLERAALSRAGNPVASREIAAPVEDIGRLSLDEVLPTIQEIPKLEPPIFDISRLSLSDAPNEPMNDSVRSE